MKKILIISAFISCCFSAANAQSIFDALRYSQLEVGGTARTIGVGGGIGALGADFSVLSTNPAGMATYRRSEFVFTPTWYSSQTDALLRGDASNFVVSSEKTNFNLNALGIVFASRPTASDWKVTAFGIGFNKLANFNQRTFFEGVSEGSITDRWLELAQGLTPSELDDFEAGLAYDGEAIYTDADDETLYYSDFDENEPVRKSQLIRQKGSVNELVFSFAGNYDEKLMMGLTLGVPILDYEEVKTYRETDPDDSNSVFEELEFSERVRTTGAGINLKMGLIYRFNQMVRMGVALHTPTGFALDDSYSTSLDYTYNFNGINRGSANSPEGSFEYRLRTPWRFIGSLGLLFDKMGFLTAEVEWLDYTSAQFNFNQTNNIDDLEYEQELNDQIERELGSAVNVRLGGEFAWNILRLRAGYGIMGSPYVDDDEYQSAISVGAGVREKSFFVDLAYRYTSDSGTYSPYLTSNAPEQTVAIDESKGKFMLTFGVKF